MASFRDGTSNGVSCACLLHVLGSTDGLESYSVNSDSSETYIQQLLRATAWVATDEAYWAQVNMLEFVVEVV